MNRKQEVLLEVLRQFSVNFNSKFDIHYEEGMGALVVPYGYPLKREIIASSIPDSQINIMCYTGVKINFN